LILLSIFGLIYGFSFGGQFARAASWLIESAGKQSAEAMGEAGLDRRCIRAYSIGLPGTINLLCEALSHKVQIFCCQQLLPSIPGIRRPCAYSRHLHTTYILPYSPLWAFGSIGFNTSVYSQGNQRCCFGLS
jgi:hypothetical protein